MQYRGYEHGCEVLFDGLWLPGSVSNYRLPQVVIEHEKLVGLEDILYDLHKWRERLYPTQCARLHDVFQRSLSC